MCCSISLACTAAHCILKGSVQDYHVSQHKCKHLPHDTNASPLPMSLSWPIGPQKKSQADTGMGPFYVLSYTDGQPIKYTMDCYRDCHMGLHNFQLAGWTCLHWPVMRLH